MVTADALIRELLADPVKFDQQGRAYELLQTYFEGHPVQTLRPLLAHNDEYVRRSAIWVASELGEQACPLLDDILPLIDVEDRFIRYHALEVTIVCGIGSNAHRFVGVARALQGDDDVIRRLAMRLISNADQSQLEAGLRLVGKKGGLEEGHRTGMETLVQSGSLRPKDVQSMLSASDPLTQRYGAVASRRLFRKFPELLAAAARHSDPDIRQFANEALETEAL